MVADMGHPSYALAQRSDTKEPFKSAEHGVVEISKPYDWLEDLETPSTQQFLAAQDELFNIAVSPPAGESDPTAARLTALLEQAANGAYITSTPRLVGEWLYLRATGQGNPYGKTYRWRREDILNPHTTSQPEVFHDEALSGNILLSSGFSENGRLWAYNESIEGSDWGVIRLKDVQTSNILTECEIRDVKFNSKPGSEIVWLGNLGYFYQYWLPMAFDGTGQRRAQLCFHAVCWGLEQAQDEVIYEDAAQPEQTFRVAVALDKSVVILEIFQAGATSSIRLANVKQQLRTDASHSVIHGDPPSLDLDFSTILWNDFTVQWEYLGTYSDFAAQPTIPPLHLFWTDNDNGQVVGFEEGTAAKKRVLVSATPESNLKTAELLPNGIILAVQSIDVQHVLRTFSISGEPLGSLDIPVSVVLDLHCNLVVGSVFVLDSSFYRPPALWHIHLLTSSNKCTTPPYILNLFPKADSEQGSDNIRSTQAFCTSDDGTKIPMFITRQTDVEVSRDTPTLLYIYGGFGISLIPHFRPEFVTFIRAFGGILVTACIRGGGEYGRAWYEAACRGHRQRLFDDIIAAARYIRSDIVSDTSSKVILMGESMGALNSSVAMLQQPELFDGLILNAGPFDIVRQRGAGARGTADFGNASDPIDFDNLVKWAPLLNIEIGRRYPPVLLFAGDKDDLVHCSQSLKMTAMLQHATQSVPESGIVCFRLIRGLGHGGNISAQRKAIIILERWIWLARVLELQVLPSNKAGA